MDITTEFRSYWVAADGTRHATRRDGADRLRTDLQPIVNLDEVRAWVALSTSDEMQRIGCPGEEDGRVFYARQFLQPNVHPSERERLAPMICEELTDDVPRYAEQWCRQFVAMRNRWLGVDGKPVVAYIDTIPMTP